ncbi:hypothetical protein [Desulforapulum autotrophicum]|uniref:hypothetical protein n=1 Tax=Desulforapulum autotrophicum TaxID=2296 RepID=UPI0003069770|nr:hypothetical protein [Desulforapulum autotrophicum]
MNLPWGLLSQYRLDDDHPPGKDFTLADEIGEALKAALVTEQARADPRSAA